MLNRQATLLSSILVAMLFVLSASARPDSAAAQPPPPEPCPLSEDACEFATVVNAALLTGNLDQMLEHVRRETHTCTADDIKGDTRFLFICRSAQAGEQRPGIPWFFGETIGGVEFGLLFPEAGYRSALAAFIARAEPSETDTLGAGRVRFAGFSCPAEGGESEDCERSYALTFTSISCGRNGLGREALAFHFQRSDESGAPVITRTGSVRARPGDTQLLANLTSWPIADPIIGGPQQSDRSTCLTASQLPDPATALLTAADLPSGWSAGACDCEEIATAADAGNSNALPNCLDELDVDSPVSRRDASTILAGGRTGPLLHQRVELFTQSEAVRSISALRRFLLARAPCAWEQDGPEGERQLWRLEELSLPAVGDDHLGVRLRLESAPLNIVEDIIVVRRGYAVATAELTTRLDGGALDTELPALLARGMDERLMLLPSLP